MDDRARIGQIGERPELRTGTRGRRRARRTRETGNVAVKKELCVLRADVDLNIDAEIKHWAGTGVHDGVTHNCASVLVARCLNAEGMME